MKHEIKHIGYKKGRILTFFNEELYHQVLDAIPDGEFELIIKKKGKKVSLDQYGYYFGGIIGTAMEFELFGGWEKNEIDDFFRTEFLSYRKVIHFDDGRQKEYCFQQSLAGLSREEMSIFIDKVLNWLAKENIFPLTPDQYYDSKYRTINYADKK